MKKILFLGVIAFLLSTLWQIPLSFSKPYIEKISKGLKLEDVSGTIWDGKVKHFTAANSYLGKVSWTVKPLQSLLSLSLKSSFTIEGEELTANGLAGLSLNKKLILKDTLFDVDASYVNKVQTKAKLAGNFKGVIKYAELGQQKVPQINGTIDWKDGATSSPVKLEPGNYRALLTPASGDLDIKLSSSDAPIELSGDIKLEKDWIFNTNLKAKTKNPGIKAMLNLTGKPQADGATQIIKKVDLKPFIGL